MENDPAETMKSRDYDFERIDMLMHTICRMASPAEEIVAALLRDFLRRREALQARRRDGADDDTTWARLTEQLLKIDAEIAKLKGAENEIYDSIFKQGNSKAAMFEGRRSSK